MAVNLSQGIYSPLPQSISDSDSEKEIQMDSLSPNFSNCQTSNDSLIHNGCMLSPHNYEKHLKSEKFSPLRKFVFAFSIFLCFLTVFIFLWVLPCSEHGTCPTKIKEIKSWESQHEGIELKGEVNVIRGTSENIFNLATLFRRNINITGSSSGIISVLGSNGNVAWYIPQSYTPIDLNCSIIDVNGDGVLDCLLIGEVGLEAVDPISGTIFWHSHNPHQDNIIRVQKLPISLPDLNGDMINELITSGKWNNNNNKLLIICGKTGEVLAEHIFEYCVEINILKIIGNNVVYSCKNGTVNFFELSLSDLRNVIFMKHATLKADKSIYVPPVKNVVTLGSKKLIISNEGECPDCHVNVTLMEHSSNKKLLDWSYKNAYGMKPKSFSFKMTKSNMLSLKGHINGFILKLWQWCEFNRNEGNGKGKKKVERHVPISDEMIMNFVINESVILITFNATNVHIINASLTSIVQLCFYVNGSVTCQPDKMNQENSLLISDLDSDGSQELISFSSSFVQSDDYDISKGNWQLFSFMKVIHIETELPKLYKDADCINIDNSTSVL